MWDTIAGLPAHPLAVHAPVIFIPLAALAAVLYVAVPRWRQWSIWWLAGFAVAAALSAWVATRTGEAFEKLRGPDVLAGLDVAGHERFGTAAFWWSLALLGAVVALAAIDRARRQSVSAQPQTTPMRALHIGVCVVVLGLSAIAVTYVVLAGHSGAELVWGL